MAKHTPTRLWIKFAETSLRDNPLHIRLWQQEPFAGGTEFVARDTYDDMLAVLKLAEKHLDQVCGETTQADLPDWFADLATIRAAIARAES
jgi:hypothetical protein